MKTISRLVLALIAAATFAAPLARAQQDDGEVSVEDGAATSVAASADSPDSAPQPYSQEELDQMLAPIALYPDDLLAQILMAATYPLEVVQAARWSRSHPGSRGENAVALVDNGDWDPSVKSLVAFPEILSMMDDKLDWTQRLGEAFLADQASVMASVQKLRRAASSAGNLATNDQMVVDNSGGDIGIEPAYADQVYMPYYDPRQIYGPWWWPAAPPVYWTPWPGYGLYNGYGYCWGPAVVVSVNFFYGGFDWHHHHAYVADHRPFYYHGRDHHAIVVHNGTWQHDPAHRRGVQYHNPVLRTQYAGGNVGAAPRADRARLQPRQANPAGRPGAEPRTAAVPNANPTARADRPQGFFPPQRTPAPTEAQARDVPNGTARPPAYAQHHQRPPVDAPQQAPQVYYTNPVVRSEQPGRVVQQAPGNSQPVGRAAPQGSAPVTHEGGGEHGERGSSGQGIQRGGGPNVGGAGRDR